MKLRGTLVAAAAWFTLCGACPSKAAAQCGAPEAGDCCATHLGPYCSDATCCLLVCALDPVCCSENWYWDTVCTAEAGLFPECGCPLCPGSDHNCLTAGGPGCTDLDCCNAVCWTAEPCCTVAWDGGCVAAAMNLCGLCPPDANVDCFTPHGSPGCEDKDCCESVCAANLACCAVAWDAECANVALVLCAGCGDPGNGSCYVPHGEPGCNDFSCCDLVCHADGWCCNVNWDQLCVEKAYMLCGAICPPGPSGPCTYPHDSPGCALEECCAAVCKVTPVCCTVAWDAECVNSAFGLCDFGCGDPSSGSCFVPHGETGCNDFACCAEVCYALPGLCCELVWDGLCVETAYALCGCPGAVAADLNLDGVVDGADLGLLLAAWATGVEMLTAPNAAAGDTFGSLMAADGDVLAIGSPEDDDLGTASGSVTVFRWSGTAWKFEQTLAASDGAPFNRIGSSVAVSGDRIIAGAPWKDGASGAAYVFRWDGTTWTEEAKLVAFGDGNPGGDTFGITVAIDGDVAMVGAAWDEENGFESGSVSMFRWDGAAWVGEQQLLPPDGSPFDEFGRGLSLSGNVAAVAAIDDDDLGVNSGSVYVYRFDQGTWVFEQKLLASDGDPGDRLGYGIAAHGDAILAGASGEEAPGDAGAAYLFRWTGAAWVEEAKLEASEGLAGDRFGQAVDLSGDFALVGALGADDKGLYSGAAYLFQHGSAGWTQTGRRVVCDGVAGDQLGSSVALAPMADGMLAGAPGRDTPEVDAGAAYSWPLAGGQRRTPDLNGDGCVDGADLGLLLASWGTCD